MNLQKYDYAVSWFERAFSFADKNEDIIFNLIEAYIYGNNFEKAEEFLKKLKYFYSENKNCMHNIDYLYGQFYSEKGNFAAAAIYFEKAALKGDVSVLLELSEVLKKQRKFDSAIEVLNRIDGTKYAVDVNSKKSEIYAAAGNISSAIKFVQKALIYGSDLSCLWTLLAKYYRMDYEFSKAEGAAYTAIRHSPDDKSAKFELAKIKKSQGKLNEYQNLLGNILNDFKNEYREIL